MGAGFNSGKESGVGLAQWLVPSVADLIFLAFLASLSFTMLSVRLLGDAGIGWHIRTGQLILSTHAIPRVDPFSSSMAGQPWFAWEWLYDIAVGWLERVAGLNGVVLLTAVVVAITFAWTFHLLTRRGTDLIIALALLLFAVSASMIHLLARPHVLSWLICVLWFWILDTSESGESRSPAEAQRRHRLLWLLPLSMVAWVNLHGGFLLGFALLGIYWLSAAWRWLRGSGEKFEEVLTGLRALKRVRQLTLVGVLSALATLINPYGWRLHAHIYHYLSSRFLMDHIEEFQSPNFHGAAEKCFAVLLLLALIALACGKRANQSSGESRSLSEVLLILFAVYSGLYASRNLPVSSLLLILVIGPRLSGAFRTLTEKLSRPTLTTQGTSLKAGFLSRMQVIDSGLRGHFWPVAAVALTCWIAFHGGRLISSPVMNAHFDAKRFPVSAVDYLKEHDQTAPVFSPDSWGGYLIYRLYPQAKVVLDDRHDFYGEEFLKSYLKTIHVDPDWEAFLVANHVTCIVVPKDSALNSILRETPRWKLVFSDNVASVFVRAEAVTGMTSATP